MNKRILEEKIINQVLEAYIQAETYYHRCFELPDIRFDLKNCTAGIAHSTYNYLRFNLILCESNMEDFLKTTVVHEVAHLIADALTGKREKHGHIWKSVMMSCFGLEPSRLHFYDTSQVARRQKRYIYRCGCRNHNISTTLHNKIVRGYWRHCLKCKTNLTFVERDFENE